MVLASHHDQPVTRPIRLTLSLSRLILLRLRYAPGMRGCCCMRICIHACGHARALGAAATSGRSLLRRERHPLLLPHDLGWPRCCRWRCCLCSPRVPLPAWLSGRRCDGGLTQQPLRSRRQQRRRQAHGSRQAHRREQACGHGQAHLVEHGRGHQGGPWKQRRRDCGWWRQARQLRHGLQVWWQRGLRSHLAKARRQQPCAKANAKAKGRRPWLPKVRRRRSEGGSKRRHLRAQAVHLRAQAVQRRHARQRGCLLPCDVRRRHQKRRWQRPCRRWDAASHGTYQGQHAGRGLKRLQKLRCSRVGHSAGREPCMVAQPA